MFSNTTPVRKVADSLKTRTSSGTKPLKLTIFVSISDLNLQEIGTKEICLVLRASFALTTYTVKDLRVRKFFITLFCAGQISVTLIGGAQFLQTVLNPASRSALATLDLTTSSVLKVFLLFHSILML